jgi:hypothetical protein
MLMKFLCNLSIQESERPEKSTLLLATVPLLQQNLLNYLSIFGVEQFCFHIQHFVK